MVLPLLLVLVLTPGFAMPRWAQPAWTGPGPSPWSAEAAPSGWGAVEARFVLRIREGEPVRVDAEYRLASPDDRGQNVVLVGPELLVTEVVGPVLATPQGLQLSLGPDVRTLTQRFSGLLPNESEGNASLTVFPAARMHVEIDAPGLDVEVAGAVDGWLSPASSLAFSWQPKVDEAPPERRVVTLGEAATAFWGDAGAIAVDARLRWRVVSGSQTTFSFAADGLDELDVQGPNVGRWIRSGDRVVINTRAPVEGLFEVRVTGRKAAKGEVHVSSPQPEDVVRVDRYWTMAKSDEGELIPMRAPGAVNAAQLPEWARGLGETAPLAQWHGNGEVRVLPMAVAPMEGPDTVVTHARYIVAAAREGRSALRMTLRVRNERRQFLHVSAPPGWRAIVVRVSNQPVSILADGQGGIYVPLEKSIETVKGLLSFPVDVEWVGDDAEWAGKGEHTFELPAVNAEIQAASWEVHLPRGFRALTRAEPSGRGMVLFDLRKEAEADDRSEEYREARRKSEEVESALANAVSAYKKNDFDTAQTWLSHASNVDASNEEVQQLQSNLDVLSGKSSGSSSASAQAASRRVKDLAKAKTGGTVKRQLEVEEEAKQAYLSGDYDKAEAAYEQALELANELQRTEQEESTAQLSKIAAANERLSSIRESRSRQVGQFEDTDGEPDVVGGVVDAQRQDFGWVTPEPEMEPADGYDVSGVDFHGEVTEGEVGGVAGGELHGAVGGLGVEGTGEGGGGYSTDPVTGTFSTNFDFDHMSVDGSAVVVSGQGYGTAEGIVGLGTLGTRGNADMPASGDDFWADEPRPEEGISFETPAEDVPAAEPAATVDKEYLARIPAGRSYQQQAQSAAGVGRPAISLGGRGGKKGRADEKPKEVAEKTTLALDEYDEDETLPAASIQLRTSSRIVSTTTRAPAMAPTASAPPPPPAPPPVTAAPATPAASAPVMAPPAKPSPAAGPSPARKDEKKKDKSRAVADDLAALGYLDTSIQSIADTVPDRDADGILDGRDMISEHEVNGDLNLADGRYQVTLVPAQPAHRPRPIERRKALVATPSPMALAMPLDGPALGHSAALLPASSTPTFTVRYKELLKENL
jgi:hypothetical protein